MEKDKRVPTTARTRWCSGKLLHTSAQRERNVPPSSCHEIDRETSNVPVSFELWARDTLFTVTLLEERDSLCRSPENSAMWHLQGFSQCPPTDITNSTTNQTSSSFLSSSANSNLTPCSFHSSLTTKAQHKECRHLKPNRSVSKGSPAPAEIVSAHSPLDAPMFVIVNTPLPINVQHHWRRASSEEVHKTTSHIAISI